MGNQRHYSWLWQLIRGGQVRWRKKEDHIKYGNLIIQIDGEAEVWIKHISEAKLNELVAEFGDLADVVEVVYGGKVESSYVCQGCGAVWSEDGIMISELSDEGSDWHCMVCGLDQADPNIVEEESSKMANNRWAVKVSGQFSIVFSDRDWAGAYIGELAKMAMKLSGPGWSKGVSIDIEKLDGVPEGFVWGCGDCGSSWNPDRFCRKDKEAPFKSCPVCGSKLVDCQAEEVKS